MPNINIATKIPAGTITFQGALLLPWGAIPVFGNVGETAARAGAVTGMIKDGTGVTTGTGVGVGAGVITGTGVGTGSVQEGQLCCPRQW